MSRLARMDAALEAAWSRTDELFELLRPEALMARPSPRRPPFVHALGHLPATAWQLVCRHDRGASARPDLDDLFCARPDLPEDETADRCPVTHWPRVEEVLAYRDHVRAEVRAALPRLGLDDGEVGEGPAERLHALLEHEAVHHELLLALAWHLDPALKRAVRDAPDPSFEPAAPRRSVEIPAGTARLGADRGEVPHLWSHEGPARTVAVAAYLLDSTPVVNGEFLEFVESGAYLDPAHWTPAGRAWRDARGQTHPRGWRRAGKEWFVRGVLGEMPLTRVFDWPVLVSWEEARAYLRWRGQRLPTEAELQWAARGTPDGGLRRHPWGDGPLEARHGNLDGRSWWPDPVGSHPAGASAFGVEELVGNGWEWTATVFAPLADAAPGGPLGPPAAGETESGDHRVLFGGSFATDRRLVRPSFRGWAHARDVAVFAKFRGVTPTDPDLPGALP